MDEDEIIKSCTRLLEKGCTMLATHHDCGAPLFRCQGEVVCPVCSFGPQASPGSGVPPSSPAEAEGEGRAEGGARSAPRAERAGRESVSKDDWMTAEGHLEGILRRRLSELTEDLAVEKDLGQMKRQLDCLEGLLKVFRSLSR